MAKLGTTSVLAKRDVTAVSGYIFTSDRLADIGGGKGYIKSWDKWQGKMVNSGCRAIHNTGGDWKAVHIHCADAEDDLFIPLNIGPGKSVSIRADMVDITASDDISGGSIYFFV